MLNAIMLYSGSILIFIWGVAHIIPVKSVVKGFGPISPDNKRIITMEWVAEGMMLCFIGFLVFLVTVLGGIKNPVSILVYRASALMLVIAAVWTLLTGARTAVVPIKICPFVKTIVAALFFMGSI